MFFLIKKRVTLRFIFKIKTLFYNHLFKIINYDEFLE
jgi:hypothetical protein